MNRWGPVREDCIARLNIILDAVFLCEVVSKKIKAAVEQPSFVDLGCCSRFFANGMTTKRFLALGVDVSEAFIKWASQFALVKAQAVTYTQQDLLGI
jgi:2-polyprenyl-3-methyl-5-hydroxy-6-metoxy-1,4-benzoquinol methylase|tara:strand:- start:154 stop:444 length:291 start_codon:yes stop_codon:yes gene_type:complete